MDALEQMDRARRGAGFLTVGEVSALGAENTIFDPFSTLISRRAVLGRGNTLYPGVVLTCAEGCALTVGDGNTFFGGTCLEAAQGGSIRIGSGSLFGAGPVCVKPGARVRVGDGGRYEGRIDLLGAVELHSGSQVLGSIRLYDCVLEAGGGFGEPDPDLRGGVIKGCGTARGLRVPRGMVVNGPGHFRQDMLEAQSNYHPKQQEGT